MTTTARKPCKIAQEEIDAGKIQFMVKAKDEPAAPAAVEEPKKEESK